MIIGIGCGVVSKFIDWDIGKIMYFVNLKDLKLYNECFEYYMDEKIKYLE